MTGLNKKFGRQGREPKAADDVADGAEVARNTGDLKPVAIDTDIDGCKVPSNPPLE
jgi:hypothetical protein